MAKVIYFSPIALIVVSLLGLSGCTGLTPPAPEPGRTLHLDLQGFQPLQNGFHYEGWAIIHGQPISTGKFNVDQQGQPIALTGELIPNGDFLTSVDLRPATAIVITIEPAGDTDAIPTKTHYAAGNVTNGSASLSMAAAQAVGNNFAGASGKYILATPTDGANNNETSGIWFLDIASGSLSQGLQLPALPEGWKYEGWVVFSGVPVTTGKFRSPVAADEAAPFSGSQPGPPFPGEDFLKNSPSGLAFPTDLSGATAVISVEPDPDDNPAPFTLKPLAGQILTSAKDHYVYTMNNQASSFPTGKAMIR